MKSILNECVEKIKKSKHQYRRYTFLLAVLALFTVIGVNWGLHRDGIAITAAGFFGQEEAEASAEEETQAETTLSAENAEQDASEELGGANSANLTETDSAAVEEKEDASSQHAASSFDADNKDTANNTTNKDSANEANQREEEETDALSKYSDDGADLEEAADWEATLPTEYSDDWAQDLIAVAESQLGYQESSANYRLAEDGSRHQGYTRYGEWYGNKYGDWSCMFADFCLFYAGISDYLPLNSGAEAWIVDLSQAGLYQDAAVYEPKEGDLVFLDQEENDGLADHVGILSSLSRDDKGQLLSFRVIEGDAWLEGESSAQDRVVENEFAADDSRIIGYAKLPQNPEQISEEEGSESADARKADEKEKKSESGDAFQAGVQTAETENYIVKVSYDENAEISADATLKVTEFDKDSEEYKKTCKETGESYDWLLDISFFRGDKEIEPKSPVQISVTLKDKTEVIDEETTLTVTHFAENGTEVKEGEELQLQEDKKGRSQISFELDSLSLVAGQTYHPATVVSASNFSQGNSYLIYKASGNYVYFLAGLSGSPVTFKVALTELARYSEDSLTADFASTEGSTLYYKGSISGTVIPASGSSYSSTLSWSNLLWSNEGGNLKNAVTSSYLGINSALSLNSRAQSITVSQGSGSAYSRFYQTQTSGGGGWWGGGPGQQQRTYYYLSFANEKISASQTNNSYSFLNADLTLAQVGSDYTPSDDSGSGEAVYTGSLDSLPLGFYSVTLDDDDVVSGLAGVVYTIYNSNGQVAGTLTTSNDLRVDLSDLHLSDGNYTMKMTHVPDGYLLDEETWSFSYSSSAKSLSLTNESGEQSGIILINPESKLEMEKTASVVDYANRSYQVDLSAKASLERLKVDDLTIHLVVDQSNSMLFPAGLEESNDGTLTVSYSSYRAKYGSVSSGLNKDLVYYAVADKTASATVWAIFYRNGSWWYQDASYFAKAYYNGQTDKIKTSDNISFPSTGAYGSATHGGKLDGSSNMYGANLASVNTTTTYQLYTASSQYNRLHYLEQSINDMLQMLAEINPNATVTLDTFTSSPQTCVSAVLGKDNGLETLQQYVGDITTDGGTRQDLALEHVRNNHAGTGDGEYLILITDGAPVSNSPSVGTATDTANASGTVYERINYQAQMLKNSGVTLATIGLGMKDVESGSKALRYISTNGPSTSESVTTDHGEWWFQPENAAELTSILCDQILSQITRVSKIENSDEIVVDYISDSFYPIDKNTGDPLLDGDQIDSSGNKVSANGAGTVRVDENGAYYVEWTGCNLNQTGWKGSIYLKAKEDFIGGNAINTNKSASLTLSKGGIYEFDKPTVNVRLLDMNELSSQVTVYKGDTINEEGNSPEDSLRYFFENTEFSKLISGSGDIYNKVGKTEADGCKASTFTLKYALGRELTEDEWTSLKNGESIHIPYSYDETEGELGYFTISLTKTGEGADYESHTAEDAKGTEELIESYSLNVSYTAYRLGSAGGDKRPETNVFNGAAGPGTEVGSVTSSLPEGKGTVESESIHKVYAIDGEIQIRKVIEDDLKSDQDQTYTFTLYRIKDDGEKEQIGDPQTLMVKAGSTSSDGSIRFSNLARGSYSVVETESDDYILEKVEVESGTNCQAIGDGSSEVIFTLGNDSSGANVIGKESGARYSSYTGSPNGILGKAVFTNKKQSYTASLPVKKVWDDSKDHSSTPVYLVLYKDNTMVQTEGEDGQMLAQVIRLDEANGWQGSFTIPLTGKDDSESPGHYSVRELKSMSGSQSTGMQAALLINDQSSIYFSTEDIMSEEDIAVFGGQSYQVYYSKEEAAEGVIDTLVVKNAAAYELPKTGGMGSRSIQTGGLLLLAGGFVYGLVLRRRRERRKI